MGLVAQLGIVSETAGVDFAELARVSAAIQKQVVRDLERFWDVRATVDPFSRLEDVPPGYWPVIIRDDIEHEAAGIHCDRNGQPYALVTSGPDWSLTASHEAIEMLTDPFGNRLIAGQSPMPEQGRVEFLVEVADPSGNRKFGYTSNGVLVSDFYTPSFFDPVAASGVQYSFTGALTRPREVLKGGYLTWLDPESGEWWQQVWFSGDQPKVLKLGQIQPTCSIRSFVDRVTAKVQSEQDEEKQRAREGAPASEESRLIAARVVSAFDRVRRAGKAKAESWAAEIANFRRQK